MTRHPHLAARLFNVPLLIHPAKLDAIVHGLGPRLGLDAPPQPDAYLTQTSKREPAGYRVLDGVAVIDVFGVLAHRARLDADSTWIQGYESIARQFAEAMADPKAQAVLLQVDSPGGEVAGAFQLADQIRAARGIKPIHAIAGDLAASAAYLIASAADRLYVTRTGQVGSIGVVLRHVDMSGALAKEGVTVTHIHAGARKIDGNPYQPLPDEVRARLQAQVDHYYQMFVEAVVANRGGQGLTRDAILATEADLFTAEQGVQLRLVDRIATPDQLLAELTPPRPAAAPKRPSLSSMRNTAMSDPLSATVAMTESVASYSQDDLEAAHESGRQLGMTEGRTAERGRLAAIFELPEATGREPLVRQLALATGLTAEAIAPILAAAPKAEPSAPASDFATHMARLGNPPVGPDPKPVDDAIEAAAFWDRAFGRAAPTQPVR